jgi:succinylarginine dihydrolase
MVEQNSKEIIFVGLPGPTHNYGGLSADNVASSAHKGLVSNPKEAALQALELVRLLMSLGIEAAVLPPQLRPHLPLLRSKFSGSDDEVIQAAAKNDPALLEKACSSSAMWVANAATVTSALDSADGKLHLTAANLETNLHRRIEAQDTHRVLAAIFAKVPDAVVHAPLPPKLRDEGAANHMRLAPRHGVAGLNVFVFGTDGSKGDAETARQTLAAAHAIAETHGVIDMLFIKQNPDLIRQGVFHNDVIAVANENILLAHELAFADGAETFSAIADEYEALHNEPPVILRIRESTLSVEEAVKTYFFNSQIVTTRNGMVIIAPMEVKELYGGKAAKLMEKIRADDNNPINVVHYCDLRQSMRNGGGPACLRLRVPMNDQQVKALQANVNISANSTLLADLTALISTHYPDKIAPQDLANPELYHRCRSVLGDMGALMKLPLLGD